MIGNVFADRYEILEKIGSGGMGDVYKAHDRKLDRIVALKLLKSQFSEDDNFIRKFKRESMAAASISHPNIVSIYDVGTEDLVEGICHYIVMEFIDGKTLKELVNEEGPLTQNRALNYTVQIAEALKVAHMKGIVHRDIKAQNIMITRDDRVKVTDFGIARIANNNTATVTSAVMGSVHYFSPEQARGSKVDRRSDIYSMGIVLFEMLTGELPFNSENPISVALMHVQNKMPKPSEFNTQVTDKVDNLVLKMTEKDINERYENVNEVIKDIKNILLNREVSSDSMRNTIPIGTKDVKKVQTASPPPKKKEPKNQVKVDEEKSNSLPIILGILAAILLFVGAVYAVPRWMNREATVDLVPAPNYVGYSFEEAEARAEIEGFTLIVSETRTDEDRENGEILEQNPTEGSEIPPGSSINVVINQKEEEITVPSVTGLSLEDAQTELAKHGLTVDVELVFSERVREDYVISQDPEYGAMVPLNSTISLVVSKGREAQDMARVPNLRGVTQSEAESLLRQEGLRLGSVSEEESAEVGLGDVTRQSHPSGTYVDKGISVDITISSGLPKPTPVEEPEPEEEPEEDPTVDDEPKEEDTEGEEQVNTKNLQIRLPDDGQQHTLKITKSSSGSEETFLQQTYSAAERVVNITLEGYRGDTFRIYVNDSLAREEAL